jgi:glycosyltransferase involved in cell wall biosynthesis
MTGISLSIIIPSIGRQSLLQLVGDIRAQIHNDHQVEIIVVADGRKAANRIADLQLPSDVVTVDYEDPVGPGGARNRGARLSKAEWLAFLEDDVAPAENWLERALLSMKDREVDVVHGATNDPAGRPIRRPSESASFIPTNLFVRRSLFEQVGGYCELYFHPQRRTYFREDSDFGFAIGERGARDLVDENVIVIHPFEHETFLGPIRWAQRYEMDPILKWRYPKQYNSHIEVLRTKRFCVHRPFPKLCVIFVTSVVLTVLLAAFSLTLASICLVGCVLTATLIWSKWRFSLKTLPVVPIVPFVMIASLSVGRRRVAALGSAS